MGSKFFFFYANFSTFFSLFCFCLLVKIGLSPSVILILFQGQSKQWSIHQRGNLKEIKAGESLSCLTSQQMCHWNRCLHLKVTCTQTKLCSVFMYAYAFWRLPYWILQRMMIASSTLCGSVDRNYKSKLSLRAMIHLAEDLSPLTKATHNIHHPEARSTECLIYGYIYNMTSITNNHPWEAITTHS